MSTELNEAVKAAMKRQGCEPIEVNVSSADAPEMVLCCDFCCEDWDTALDECSVVGRAVRIGWEAAVAHRRAREDAMADAILRRAAELDAAIEAQTEDKS